MNQPLDSGSSDGPSMVKGPVGEEDSAAPMQRAPDCGVSVVPLCAEVSSRAAKYTTNSLLVGIWIMSGAQIPALRSIQLGMAELVSIALPGAVQGPPAIEAVDSHSPKPPV